MSREEVRRGDIFEQGQEYTKRGFEKVLQLLSEIVKSRDRFTIER